MSPLSVFLAVIVSLTAILVAYLTKQFQKENLNYLTSNPMTNSNPLPTSAGSISIIT